jgi:hypothetical protein
MPIRAVPVLSLESEKLFFVQNVYPSPAFDGRADFFNALLDIGGCRSNFRLCRKKLLSVRCVPGYWSL